MPKVQPSGGGGVSRNVTDCSKANVTGDGNKSTPLPTAGVIGVGGMGVCSGVSGSSVDGEGVEGSSTTGMGVYGQSQSNSGVEGGSASGWGVWGQTSAGPGGVHGTVGLSGNTPPQPSCGVWGDSHQGPGVCATSVNSFGVWAKGSPAGHFDGDVEITGNVKHTGASVEIAKGNLNLTGGGNINVQSGGDVLLSDCAEDFDVLNSQEAEPGTVMVINGTGVLEPADRAYDKRVAGIVSGAGSCRPAIVLNRQCGELERAPIALFGTVYCKVDSQYGEIEVGDLLTTSPTPGHAMKAADPSRAFGAVIGKALQPMDLGKGLIPVLIALQ